MSQDKPKPLETIEDFGYKLAVEPSKPKVEDIMKAFDNKPKVFKMCYGGIDYIKLVEYSFYLELEKERDRYKKALALIDAAYSMRAADVWITKNMSPHDYLVQEISKALSENGEL